MGVLYWGRNLECHYLYKDVNMYTYIILSFDTIAIAIQYTLQVHYICTCEFVFFFSIVLSPLPITDKIFSIVLHFWAIFPQIFVYSQLCWSGSIYCSFHAYYIFSKIPPKMFHHSPPCWPEGRGPGPDGSSCQGQAGALRPRLHGPAQGAENPDPFFSP